MAQRTPWADEVQSAGIEQAFQSFYEDWVESETEGDLRKIVVAFIAAVWGVKLSDIRLVGETYEIRGHTKQYPIPEILMDNLEHWQNHRYD